MVILIQLMIIETIELELIFADQEVLERRIAKTTRSAMNDKSLAKELVTLKKLMDALTEAVRLRLLSRMMRMRLLLFAKA